MEIFHAVLCLAEINKFALIQDHQIVKCLELDKSLKRSYLENFRRRLVDGTDNRDSLLV